MSGKHLITGGSSGLGKFLLDFFDGNKYHRDSKKKRDQEIKRPYKSIIHAAYNTNRSVYSKDYSDYISDTVGLTKKLINIPHRKFIFCSTIDVYPNNSFLGKETDEINLFDIKNLYSLTKLICEKIVLETANNPLILRLGYMVGDDMRNSNVKRSMSGKRENFSICGSSSFNIITHKQVGKIMLKSFETEQNGILNAACSPSIDLQRICYIRRTEPSFGSYRYESPKVNTNKLTRFMPEMKMSSEDIIRNFTFLLT